MSALDFPHPAKVRRGKGPRTKRQARQHRQRRIEREQLELELARQARIRARETR